MRLRLLLPAFLILTGLGLAGDAAAAVTGHANVQNASQWCYGMISGGGGAIIQPLVECFTDTSQGIIPLVTTSFLVNAKADYLPTIGTMFVLAIAWFGLKLYTGQVQRLKGETIVLGLKMAGIMLFLDNAPAFYLDLVNILQQLSETMAQVATSLHSNGFCASSMTTGSGSVTGAKASGGSAAWQFSLWQGWDCIFKYLLGLSSVGFAAGSIASFLAMMFFSMGTGIVIFFTGLYLIIRLLTAAFRFIHIYLMSVLALSFIFCLGYIFVPLLLFNNTMKYFTKWMSLLMSFIITPVIMFAFMGMMLIALDIAIFSGKYSVFCEIGGSGYCGTNKGDASGSGGGINMFKDITGNIIPAGNNSEVSGNKYIEDDFLVAGGMGIDSQNSVFTDNSLLTTSGMGYTTSTIGTGIGGLQGQLNFIGGGAVSGSNYNATEHPEVAKQGLDIAQLNLGVLASGAGSSCKSKSLGTPMSTGGGSGTSYYYDCPWIEGVLISLCVAALIAYIMVSLLSYIPTLASNMSTSLSDDVASKGLNFAKDKILGETPALKALGVARQGSLGAAEGGAAGAADRATDSFLGMDE